MHYKILTGLAILATPFAGAQNLANLPKCAQNAATQGISSSGCGAVDFACICKATAFINTVQNLINSECSGPDQAATLTFAQSICASVGVKLNVPSPGGSSSAAPSSTSASASSVASVATPTYPTMTPTTNSTNGTTGNTTAMPFTGPASAVDLPGAAMVLVVAGVVGCLL